MAEPSLFIGGPKDGERLRVDPDMTVVRIPVHESGAIWGDGPPPKFGAIDYRRVRLAENNTFYSVFVCDSEPVLKRLIDGYKKDGSRMSEARHHYTCGHCGAALSTLFTIPGRYAHCCNLCGKINLVDCGPSRIAELEERVAELERMQCPTLLKYGRTCEL